MVADGAGSWRPVRFGDPVEVEGEVVVDPRPDPALTVGLTPTKGDRPEWAVQKLTELSIDHIVILRTERSVVRWEGDRVAHHLERLRRIAREAAMQSRRSWLPDGRRASTLSPIIPAPPWPTPVAVPRPGDDGVLLCGPEGGWSDAERAEARDRVDLGPAVLRAETAAVAAGALLAALRHGLVRPA